MDDMRIDFRTLQDSCKYNHIGRDRDGHWDDTCRHPDNTPAGSSWGRCRMFDCPLWIEKHMILRNVDVYVDGKLAAHTNEATEIRITRR